MRGVPRAGWAGHAVGFSGHGPACGWVGVLAGWLVAVSWWGRCWLVALLENCIVGASIFACSYGLWSRWYGRTVDALAPGADEGRGRLR